MLEQAAEDIDAERLNQDLGGSYGIFSGAPTATALLCFTAERARWVAAESWHPQQQGAWRADGCYELSVPYHRDEELILDILRYGHEVEVLAPPSLRTAVAQRLRLAVAQYGAA